MHVQQSSGILSDAAWPARRRATARPAHDRAFFGHPRGLSTLFFTEMWERFSYYGMRALLILFMTAPPAAGGLGFDTATAGAIYGLYTSMVYLTSLPGGWIADRLIGQRRAVLYGGILIACGHFSMAVPVADDVLPRPGADRARHRPAQGNISVIVGQLYAQDDQRRDAGFSIFYMGINLGAFLAPLVCGYLGQRVSWHLGFAAAGVGMTLGLVQYVLGAQATSATPASQPATGASPERPPRLKTQASALGRRGARRARRCSALGIVHRRACRSRPTQIADAAGYVAARRSPSCFFGWLFSRRRWTPAERRRLYVDRRVLPRRGALLVGVRAGRLDAEPVRRSQHAQRRSLGWSFPSSWFQSLQPLFIIAFAPVFAWLWMRLGPREPSSPVKFALGLLLRRAPASSC